MSVVLAYSESHVVAAFIQNDFMRHRIQCQNSRQRIAKQPVKSVVSQTDKKIKDEAQLKQTDCRDAQAPIRQQ